jgi:hypothetical protein
MGSLHGFVVLALSGLAATSPTLANADPTAAPKMPWQEELAIGAGSVAGAAVIAGGIAEMVKLNEKKSSTDAPRSSSTAVPEVVDALAAPADVQSVHTPATLPPPVNFRLYKAPMQQSPTGLFNETIFMGVATFLLFLGCVFIGLGGILYYKRNFTKNTSDEADEEAEGDEEEGPHSEEELEEELLS